MKYLVAATDLSSRPKLLASFRGKTAKEVYRCGKGIVMTSSFQGPLMFAGKQLAVEVTSGYVASTIGSAVEGAIGYVSGFGFVRWVYKACHPGRVKAFARLGYNILGLPFTIYAKGVGCVTDVLQIGYLEEKWFGEKVYIFDDNRLWVEKNFTLSEALTTLEKGVTEAE